MEYYNIVAIFTGSLNLCGHGNLITTVWKVREFLLSNRVRTLIMYLLYRSQPD